VHLEGLERPAQLREGRWEPLDLVARRPKMPQAHEGAHAL
jgi:hypothetical protein